MGLPARSGALLSYTSYFADCSTVHYTWKGNEYYLEADYKKLRNGQSMQNIGPMPNGTSRCATMPPKQSHVLTSIGRMRNINDHQIIRSTPR